MNFANRSPRRGGCADIVVIMEAQTGHPTDEGKRLQRCIEDLIRLNERVAQLTSELAATKEMWQQEAAQRGQAEEALREVERESRLIVDSIPGLVALLSATGEVEVVNRQLLDYFGQTLLELRHWQMTDTVHPEDLPHVVEIFAHSIGSGIPYNIVQRFRRSDGIYRWFENSGFPLRDVEGRITRWCVLLTDIDERKRAEEAHAASEQNLKLIIDTIPAMAWSARPDGSAEFFNQHYLDYVGLSAEQAAGWGWTAALHPEELNGLAAMWASIRTSDAPGEAEARLRRHDGEYRWFLFRAHPLRDESGNIVKWYGTNTDIDDRKRAEAQRDRTIEELQAHQDLLDLAQKSARAVAFDWYIQRDINMWSPELEALYGLPPGGFDGTYQGWKKLVYAPDWALIVRAIKHAHETGEIAVEFRVVWPDGSLHWLATNGRMFFDERCKPSRMVGFTSDVTPRKLAEEDLRRSEAFLVEAQRLSSTGSFSWCPSTNGITWSDEVYMIFEFDRSVTLTPELIGTRIHPDDFATWAGAINQTREGGRFELDYRLLMPDRRVKHLHAVAHATRNSAGELEYIGAFQDVTAQRVSEEALSKLRSELAHVSRVATLGALTASIAHEVNQPLAGIITNASTSLRMLAADPPNIDGARETARRTIRDGHRAADVITRLRALFSKQAPATEPVDLNEATREVISLSQTELQRSGIILRMELADGLPTVTGDRVQLQQVIINLLMNAVDAMSNVADRPRQLLVRTESLGDQSVRLSMRDAGVGFDPESAERLFDAFYTTKSGGMGIGLSVSRSIIENHQGRLWATPNEGPGATFSFSIPCASGLVTDAERMMEDS